MPASERKHTALKALRQHLRLSEIPNSPERRLSPPVQGDRLDPALFASGLHEMVGEQPAAFAAALAFTLSVAAQRAQPHRSLFCGALARERQEQGVLYGAGLYPFGLDPSRVFLLTAPSEKALLWAAEEAASCRALGAAVIVLGNREKLYGFTASRRLKLRQEASGVPLFLVRSMTGEPTAITARWKIGFAPGQGEMAPGTPLPLLGRPRFRVSLERYAGWPPQEWEIELDEAHTLRVVAPVSDRPADAHRIRNGRAA
jgi:protein ImuA